VIQLNPECVLELLTLSSNVNECKPLPPMQRALLRTPRAAQTLPESGAVACAAMFSAEESARSGLRMPQPMPPPMPPPPPPPK